MSNDNWVQQLLTMGIGTTSFVAEKMKEVSDQFVQEGRIDPEQARAIFDELMIKLRTDQGQLQEQVERQMRNALRDLGVPRQTEMDEMRGRIDRLEHQVRDLENRLWR
ncbi:MAG: phasin family protein [Spirulinaceae cyanobacterium SM2_1_0]|nr:phasin family protein [Spirulinaceae cyanobacterium SM2_1_0]